VPVTVAQAAPGVDVLTSDVEIPALGHLPINAFVLHGAEPVLVDTGSVIQREEFATALRSTIDVADLRWIWLTHTDFDHVGLLGELLAENAELRVITTFLGVGIMGLSAPLPMDRVNLVNPGQTITLGDRTLTAVRPPTFDNPVTTGFQDQTSGALFSADAFGALLQAVPQSAADIPAEELQHGQVTWATVDSPWLHNIDPARFASSLNAIRELHPTMILSSHLPAAPGRMTEQLLASLEAAPGAQPFVGPDQAALEQMLGQMTG
jgi:flavorubredoxin